MAVNIIHYTDKLNKFLKSEMHRRRQTINPFNIWFQQDGAHSSHTVTATMNIIGKMFPGRFISRFGYVH